MLELNQNSDPLESLFWNLEVEFLKGFSIYYKQIQVNEKGSKHLENLLTNEMFLCKRKMVKYISILSQYIT